MAKSIFDLGFEYVLQNESRKFVNDPKDSGGPTKFGITKRVYEAYFNRIASIQEIQDMNEQTAKAIYFENYFKSLKLHLVISPVIAIALFDCAVLYGPGTASKLGQTSLEKCGFTLKIDGSIGDKTLKLLNEVGTQEFIENLHQVICDRIKDIVDKDPKNERFLKGWLNRADRLLNLVAFIEKG